VADPIRVLISACLLGDEVRYDGGHKRDASIVETVGTFVEFVKVCPEVDCGLSVPREPMRLVGDLSRPRLVTVTTGSDLTARMEDFARAKVRALEPLELCGYICKSGSPSSGMAGVEIYNASGGVDGRGAGVFTRIFMEHFPDVPVEDEGRLQDPLIRAGFIERIVGLKRRHDLHD
jgi:uncharacterized protein YbbK (DUF523 family)